MAAEDARKDRQIAEADLVAAEARRTSLIAVLAVERLEDEGARSAGSASWTEAARTASSAQRSLAIAEANRSVLQADRDTERAHRALQSILVAADGRQDAAIKGDREKAAAIGGRGEESPGSRS